MSFHIELLRRESYDTIIFPFNFNQQWRSVPNPTKKTETTDSKSFIPKKSSMNLIALPEFLKQPYISNWTRKHQNNEYCQSKNSWLMANKHYTKISFLISQLWNIIPASKLLAIWVVHRSRCVCPFLLKLKPTNISYKEDNCW